MVTWRFACAKPRRASGAAARPAAMPTRCRNCRLDVRLLGMCGGFHSSRLTSTPTLGRSTRVTVFTQPPDGGLRRSPEGMVEWAGVGTLTLLLVDNAPASLLSDDSNAPFANARVWASAVRNCHNHHDFIRTRCIVARNRHRSEMIKRPNIVLMD